MAPVPLGTPLQTYVGLQRALDTDILTLLGQTALSVETELKSLQRRVGIGAEVRSYQLSGTKVAIDREMARYWERVGNTTAAAQLNAAAEAAEQTLLSSGLVDRVFDAPDVAHMIAATRDQAANGLEAAMERISGTSYIPLAESVYDNAAYSSGKIDEIVNTALARGSSAKELADAVYDYVNPNTPGGARYASMRLARTELNNAFHAASVRQAQEQPFTLAVLWNLSGSHPVPDECNTYAERVNYEGGQPGEFRPEEVPIKPHPNCLCYTTTVDMDLDDFLRLYESGGMDDYIDSAFPDIPSRQPPAPSGLPPLKSGPARDIKILEGVDYDRGVEWQTFSDLGTRAEMLWSETHSGAISIRRILENRENGIPDLQGVSTSMTDRNWIRYGAKDWETEELLYTSADLEQDLLNAADYMAEKFENPETFSELYRGMNLQDRDLFSVGDTVDGHLTSWSGKLDQAQMYAWEGGTGDGWPVVMVVRGAQGVRLGDEYMRRLFSHDEHLLRGAFKVTGKKYDGQVTILEVTYAP